MNTCISISPMLIDIWQGSALHVPVSTLFDRRFQLSHIEGPAINSFCDVFAFCFSLSL